MHRLPRALPGGQYLQLLAATSRIATAAPLAPRERPCSTTVRAEAAASIPATPTGPPVRARRAPGRPGSAAGATSPAPSSTSTCATRAATHGGTGFAEPDLVLTDDDTLIQTAGGENEALAYMGMLSDPPRLAQEGPGRQPSRASHRRRLRLSGESQSVRRSSRVGGLPVRERLLPLRGRLRIG